MTADDLTAIRRAVAGRLAKRRAIDDDTPLVSGGLIDSMSIVDLILELESATGVHIPVSEVEPDDFDTIRKIAATVARFR
jgi:acyl carrier protein